ncbi:MAG: NBR1-Ig-like domain-containing protein, partial [Chloroflexota bacterium]|nr:NBR1-Ig-like domain-containing protein [Chloroflexota bacterium]
MNKPGKLFWLVGIMLGMILAGCNMPKSDQDLDEVDIMKTAARETVAARLTLNVAETEAASSAPTATQEGQATPTEGESAPSPTLTTEPPPSSTKTPLPCNRVEFVEDVTIPDGTEIDAGDAFTKTWRLKNTGTCSWTSGYDLIFDHGDSMGAPGSVSITSGTVASGSSVDVSVDLTAPDAPGTYRGDFLLRSSDNVVFGMSGGRSFWVEIKVIPEDTATPTATSTATSEAQSGTLHRIFGRSKTLGLGVASDDTRLGIAVNGDPLRAFVDFDLAELPDLSNSSTIQSATLGLSNYSGESCFEFLHPLLVYRLDYGNSPDYQDDFNAA